MLLIVIFGVVEMARLVLVYTTVANSARAGARYAIVHGGDLTSGASGNGNDANVKTVVKNFASAGTLQLADSNITVTYSPSNSGLNGHRKSRIYVQSDAVLFRQFVKRASWKYKSGSNYVLRAL